MKVIGITDVHGNTAGLHSIASLLSKADLVIISGDITHFGRAEHAEKVLTVVKGYNDNLLAVPGNCDHADVGNFLNDEEINLDGQSRRRGKYTFIGLGGSLPTPGGNTPNERTDEELAGLLLHAMKKVDPGSSLVLVSHQPPIDTSCDVAGGMHVGSRAVRTFIENHGPMVCFTGHIHESSCIDSIGNTKIVNPGPLDDGCCSYVELTDGGSDVRILHGNEKTSHA